MEERDHLRGREAEFLEYPIQCEQKKSVFLYRWIVVLPVAEVSDCPVMEPTESYEIERVICDFRSKVFGLYMVNIVVATEE